MIELTYHMDGESFVHGKFESEEEASNKIIDYLEKWNVDLSTNERIKILIKQNKLHEANLLWEQMTGEYWTFRII